MTAIEEKSPEEDEIQKAKEAKEAKAARIRRTVSDLRRLSIAFLVITLLNALSFGLLSVAVGCFVGMLLTVVVSWHYRKRGVS